VAVGIAAFLAEVHPALLPADAAPPAPAREAS
jgi:hypothetical protein